MDEGATICCDDSFQETTEIETHTQPVKKIKGFKAFFK